MASLNEIRKRFIGATGNVNDGVTDEGPNMQQPELAGAAARIFDPLETFQTQVSQIVQNAGITETTLGDAARTVEELKTFHADMTRLVDAYQTLRPFETALDSESTDELRQHFDAIARIFYENITAIASLLEPAREIHSRILRLGRILNSLDPIQEQLRALAENFKPHPLSETAVPDQPPSPSATVSILTR